MSVCATPIPLVNQRRRGKLGRRLWIAIFLSFYSLSSQAIQPETQKQLLYDLLGRLNYVKDGTFNPVDDVAMKKELSGMINQYSLSSPPNAAYIVNLSRDKLAWTSSPRDSDLKPYPPHGKYLMSVVEKGGKRLVDQHFWVKNDKGEREEFQMVVRLPL